VRDGGGAQVEFVTGLVFSLLLSGGFSGSRVSGRWGGSLRYCGKRPVLRMYARRGPRLDG
jgi:hypothetical protein